MESKLFFIGVGVGVFALVLRGALFRWVALRNRLLSSLWHGIFCSGVAGVVVHILTSAVHQGETQWNAIAAAACAGMAWGLLRGWMRGRQEQGREFYLKEDLEWVETAFSAVLLAAFLMYFFVQAFKIPSGSMRVTLLEGDHLFVNKFIYGVRIPFTDKRIWKWQPVHRGDVVVFQFPSDDPDEIHCGSSQYGKDFIKRAVAVPGDVVEIRSGTVYVNGKPSDSSSHAQYLDLYRNPPPHRRISSEEYQKLWETRRLDRTMGEVMRDYFGPITVPPRSYFAMGDNRDRSCDSRFWGPVPDSYLKGKAWVLYWPPNRAKVIR